MDPSGTEPDHHGCHRLWQHIACRQGLSVAYFRVPRLFEELRIAHADGSFTKRLIALAKTDPLILDDWALAPIGQVERNKLSEILDDRIKTCATEGRTAAPWITQPRPFHRERDRLFKLNVTGTF